MIPSARRRARPGSARQTMSVELHHPVPDDLKRHAANLRRLGARRSVVNRSQRQKPARLAAVLRQPRRAAKLGGVKILSKRDRHRKLHRSQHRIKSSPIRESPESRSAGVGINWMVSREGPVTLSSFCWCSDFCGDVQPRQRFNDQGLRIFSCGRGLIGEPGPIFCKLPTITRSPSVRPLVTLTKSPSIGPSVRSRSSALSPAPTT
jgi:hypothetical protein